MIIQEIIHEIHVVLPKNKISLIKRKSHCIDVSCYSNQWEGLLGWLANGGPKSQQNIRVPQWIKNNSKYAKKCLKGLIETDGSIYYDRGYLMVNFTNIIPQIILDFTDMLDILGYNNHVYLRRDGNNNKKVVRVSSDAQKLVRSLAIISKNPVKN
ncbi:MAG: LAGLIDADG family homing endonuclease [Minisyncoccia bacterium]